MKNVGYKEMLRNRIPTTLNLTLLWCKCKTEWVEYVYNNMIRIFADKQERDKVIRVILKNRTQDDPYGAHKNSFDFKGSINWFDLNEDEEEHWKYVSDWYDWFDHYYPIIVSELKELYYDDPVGNVKSLVSTYAMNDLDDEWQDKLAEFLIKNICKI